MMSISEQNATIEEDLIIELEWLTEEFEILFKSKIGNLTELDKKIANDILDYFLEIADFGGNVELLNYLDEVVDNIENKYSDLLKEI
ncbi:MAG: hypothetical protein ACFFE4_16835 [Candidatus Thorarchaeota archaeon]